MSQQYRLDKGGLIDRSKSLTFTFDGKAYQGFEGDTLASALVANGVKLIGRSFKYHRPRGLIASGAEEPNALMDLGQGCEREPNARATLVELFDGLEARSVNNYPNLNFDIGAVNSLLAKLFVSGFYYKTFMWPRKAWMFYEHFIRKAAGLGIAPNAPDPARYEKTYGFCDIMVVGAGPAGLSAALAAGRSGARVVLIDDQARLGGSLLTSSETINNKPGLEWVADTENELEKLENVTILKRTQLSLFYDHNYLGLWQKIGAHRKDSKANIPREMLHKYRAKQLIIATGAHERPLVFADNDRPGIMLASAVQTYIRRYAALPGKCGALFTNNDSGYAAILAMLDANLEIAGVIDMRAKPDGPLYEKAKARGVKIFAGHVVTNTFGKKGLKAIEIAPVNAENQLAGKPSRMECDFLANSGGWSPAVHIHCQAKGKLLWDEARGFFLPNGAENPANPNVSIGACNGAMTTAQALNEGHNQGRAIAKTLGFDHEKVGPPPEAQDFEQGSIRFMWIVPSTRPLAHSKAKWMIDYQNDSTAADIKLAVREGMHSIEHVKRYTTTGMATDQGKTSNINALAIVAEALGKKIPDVGTTTFRPPYTPTTFAAIAGRDYGDLLDPERQTPMHSWHVEQGAFFEDVGQWKRPYCFPRDGESHEDAVRRECKATRDGVGILDASTLGKIIVKGPDAAEFLNRIYTNAFAKLGVGKCRYGLMLKEDGFVFDDGVSSRLSNDSFLMTTTTGGAAAVLDHLEEFLQTEWPDLKVYLTSVTEQWATASIAGPKSRELLARLCKDWDLSDKAFPFMTWKEGDIEGIPARIFRISFTGDLSYEINVPADYGLHLWQRLMALGEDLGITPYGTQAMHVLRAEKGFIIVGQETDGSVIPQDLDMDWIVSKKKSDFIGKRSLCRPDMLLPERKQLVGLLTTDPMEVLEEGAQLVRNPAASKPMPMVGHVTSSYYSPACGRSIALALVKGGLAAKGERLYAPLADGRTISVQTCDTVFFDKEGTRQHG